MASKHLDTDNIQLEADSDNEVVLVHRMPDSIQDNGGATRIPGRSESDNESDSHDTEILEPHSLEEEVIESPRPTESMSKILKEIAELKTFLVNNKKDMPSPLHEQKEKDKKNLEGKVQVQEDYQFNLGRDPVGYFQPKLSMQGERANPAGGIQIHLGGDRRIPGGAGLNSQDAQGRVSQQVLCEHPHTVCHGADRLAGPSSVSRLVDIPSPGEPYKLNSASRHEETFTQARPYQMDRGDFSAIHRGQGVRESDSQRPDRGYGRRSYESGLNHSSVYGNQPSKKKPATFDGTTSWHDYITQFELVAEMNQWSDESKALELATSLRSQAQSVLSDLSYSQRRDYYILVKSLEERFEPENQAELYRAQLKTRTRKKNEALTEYAQEVKKLVRKAYPKATADLRDKLTCDAFIDSLYDNEMEWAIYQSKPSSVEDAVRVGLEFEAFRFGRQRRTGQRPQIRMYEESDILGITEETIDRVAGRVAQLVKGGNNGNWNAAEKKSSLNSRGRCHICNQEGHWKNQCPRRNKSLSRPNQASQSVQTDNNQSGN